MKHKTPYPRSLLLVLVALFCPMQAMSQGRCALVIGNDDYKYVDKLTRAASDAYAVGGALRPLGFTVLAYTNLNRQEINQAIGNLVECSAAGGVGLLFYAGHGVQLDGENFLLPIDVKVTRRADLADEAISMERVMNRLAEAKAQFTLLILDACRDNPFPKVPGRTLGGPRGLAISDAPHGLMVVYSAGRNERALDHLGPTDLNPNGLFTRVFLKYLPQPGLSVQDMLQHVRTEVNAQAATVRHQQNPALYDGASKPFYFDAQPPEPPRVAPDPPATRPKLPQLQNLPVEPPAEGAKPLAKAPDHFDGQWEVAMKTQTGACSPWSDFSVTILHGSVKGQLSGQKGLYDVKGSVSEEGAFSWPFGEPGGRGSLSGQLSSRSGQWHWAAGSGKPCTGVLSLQRKHGRPAAATP